MHETRLVRKDNPSIEVVSTLERVPGVATIIDVDIDPEGRLQLDYNGTLMDWNGQHTQTDAGERIFIDENDQEVLEHQVVVQKAGEIFEPTWRSPIAAARDAVEPMLVLSTSHVTPRTMARLNDPASRTAPHRVIGHEYGALLFVGEVAPCPDDLAVVLAFARACRCVWINLDRDAAPIDGLPTYAWDEEAAA